MRAFHCITLAPCVLKSWPNSGSLRLVRNPERLVWFRALNISVRICNFTRSMILKFLARLKFRFQSPGARKAPGLKLPGRMGAPDALETGILWNAAGLRYRRVLW